MANVMFKRGLQSALFANGFSPIDGVFYLTTDTGRLYVGQENTTSHTVDLVELNKSIIEVTGASENSTTHKWTVTTAAGTRDVKEGEFYYYAANNILMVGSSNGNLVQINPDTDVHLGSGTMSFVTPVGSDIYLDTKLYNTNADGSAQTSTAAVSQQIKFSEGQNVTLSATNDTLTINAASSVLSAAAATSPDSGVNLSVDNQAAPVNVIGDGGTTVTLDNGKIKISSVGANGVTYTLSGYSDAVSVPTGEAGLRRIDLSNADNTHNSSVYLPIPQIKLQGENNAITTYDGTITDGKEVFTLPVYTKSEVDGKFSTIASAMSYKGATSTVPTTGGSGAGGALVAGDMWKASSAISLTAAQSASGAAVTAKTGDLLIYNGSAWDVVPSGDDQNITAVVGDHLLKISDSIASSTAGNVATIGYDNTQDANKTKVQFADTGAGTTNYTLSAALPVYHDSTVPAVTTTATGSVAYAGSVTVPQVTIDSYGRVTGLEARTLTLPSAQTLSGSISVPASGDQSFSITLSDNGGTAQFYSKTLTMSTDSNHHDYIDLTWGEF